MKEGVPDSVSPISEPTREVAEKSMTEEQTHSFLKEKGIVPLHDWQPGQPLLYVLEEFTRQDDGPYEKMPVDKRPSIARLDSPTFLNLEHEREGKDDIKGRIVYPLANEAGGQIDYYAINPKTKRPEVVLTRNTVVNPGHAYNVRKENLFSAADGVFPKSGK